MTLQEPADLNWNMNTGASSHLNSSTSNLSTIFNSCMYPSVLVGDRKSIPVTNTGHRTLRTPHRTLHLNKVLITPNIVKNLISVRQFVCDNKCTIEFDEFGFFVKDFWTRQILLRCDSTGDLYPVTSSSYPKAYLVSQHTRLQRLSQPGSDVLRSLVSNNFISCNKTKSPMLCHACQLGKHVRLPFSLSETVVTSLFDIIHSDLWTSPLLSVSGIKYYVLFLDHFSHYLWVYPLRNKSDALSKFIHFHAYVKNQFKCDIKSLQCDHGRSLYGLKQAPRVWFQRFTAYAARVGFHHSRCDTSLFIYRQGTDIAYLLLYVDDIFLTASSTAFLQRIITSLHVEFSMTDLGPLNYFLGVSVTRHTSRMFLSKQKYATERQFTIYRSSVEAEYQGVTNAVAETCWLRHLLRELHTPLSTATLVYCDNVSVVYLSSNHVQHQRTKHIEINIHFVRDLISTVRKRVIHVPSHYQYVDIFTKRLPTTLFDKFRYSLSVRSSLAQTAGGVSGLFYLCKHPVDGFSVGLLDESNIFEWSVTIIG
nr:ribonuclease H-like domain-containing protein [Tanacetum cinerariifolium]